LEPTITSRPSEHREKYVTRAEYDELKARFDELSAQVQRLLQMATAPPYYQMGLPSGIPGTSTEAVSTYAGPSSLMYQSMMPPPHTYPHHRGASPQGPPERFIKPEDYQASSRHHHTSTGATSVVPSLHVATSMRPRPPEQPPVLAATIGTATGAKHSPLSLASITSPYNPDPQSHQQSKNCHAQILMLGECLRTGSRQPLEGPAIHYEMIRLHPLLRSRVHRPQSQGPLRKYMAKVRHSHQPAHSYLCVCSPFPQFYQRGKRIESH